MKAIIWGSRGSLPSSFNSIMQRKKIYSAIEKVINFQFTDKNKIDQFIDDLPFALRGAYGCNTSCVEVSEGNNRIILDAGTGLRDYGNELMKRGGCQGEFHIILSHLHWDHIQGFPFFIPAYLKGNKINIYSCHENARDAFVNQQNPVNFPVQLEQMSADIRFINLAGSNEYDIAGFKIKTIKQNHPGISYGYRIEKNGRVIVYSTDSEHTGQSPQPFLDFIKDADLLIFDAQYSLSDAIDIKQNWGHSSNMIGVELSLNAKVKRLCLFHTEPVDDDEKLDVLLSQTKKYAAITDPSFNLQVYVAYEGLAIDF
jgi:phosphoribosyl 1,2-cyclic phosphodiesterase